jgi:hypothetical protein
MNIVRFLALLASLPLSLAAVAAEIGSEKAIEVHLEDGQEFRLPLNDLLKHGGRLFSAPWTGQDGGGRPLTKGTGGPLSDAGSPLVFPRNFNRISAPDANSCAGCHALPRVGGGGDIVTNVFVLGHRFDSATFDSMDPVSTRGALDERGLPVTQGSIANERATLGMFGAGYIELLAREMTARMQHIRNGIPPGGTARLTTKGVQFGTLSREADGSWNVAAVEGIPSSSLVTSGPQDPPSLVIRPFHQAARVVSLREFTNNAFNHHHGIQSSERFGSGLDPDGDGFTDELSRADITAATIFQATLPAPGQVIPRDPEVEAAIHLGRRKFAEARCTDCHKPVLKLDSAVFVEPNPFNPPGNLLPGQAPGFRVDLSSRALPAPRLAPEADGSLRVPAFTDMRVHDMCDGPDDPNREPLDMQVAPGSSSFFEGNCSFLTRKLWGVANEPPFFHHGKFTTLREAILQHRGEATSSRIRFEGLTARDRDSIIEFLKSLQVLPPGTKHLVVDDRGAPRSTAD